MEVCEVDRDEARALLDESGGTVKTAIVMHFLGVSREEAERALDAARRRHSARRSTGRRRR